MTKTKSKHGLALAFSRYGKVIRDEANQGDKGCLTTFDVSQGWTERLKNLNLFPVACHGTKQWGIFTGKRCSSSP